MISYELMMITMFFVDKNIDHDDIDDLLMILMILDNVYQQTNPFPTSIEHTSEIMMEVGNLHSV